MTQVWHRLLMISVHTSLGHPDEVSVEECSLFWPLKWQRVLLRDDIQIRLLWSLRLFTLFRVLALTTGFVCISSLSNPSWEIALRNVMTWHHFPPFLSLSLIHSFLTLSFFEVENKSCKRKTIKKETTKKCNLPTLSLAESCRNNQFRS